MGGARGVCHDSFMVYGCVWVCDVGVSPDTVIPGAIDFSGHKAIKLQTLHVIAEAFMTVKLTIAQHGLLKE